MSLRPLTVRWRLTFWYVLVLAGILLLYIPGTSLILFAQLRSELDRHAIQELETVEGLLTFDRQGQLHLSEEYHNHVESKLVPAYLLEVLSPDGRILIRNSLLGKRNLRQRPFPDEGVGGYSPRSGLLSDGTAVRVVSRRHSVGKYPILIRLAYPEEVLWRRVQEYLTGALLALPLALAAAGLAGYFLARRALAPIGEMAKRAEGITADRLSERLPGGEIDDELGQLARVFNVTLTRLEQSFEQLRRFTSDASHELRTPLTAIRSVGEVGLQRDGTPAHCREIIGSMLEEVNRLARLVDSLLVISRADAGHLQLHPSRFSAMTLVREVASLFEVLVEEKSQTLAIEGDAGVELEADRTLMRHALMNLIHNAVKFSPIKGTISVRVRANPEENVRIEIADTGPGIPEEDRGKVFDRFYRVDMGRSRSEGGAGLGLSIVKWVVQAHSGTIDLGRAPEGGCLFRVTLPGSLREVRKT